MFITPHQPIQIKELTIAFGNKNCIIEPFSKTIYYGNRIAIIGRNGSGKTSLIKTMLGILEPSEGSIKIPNDINMGYVPQQLENDNKLSGGQRFNQGLSVALALQPNLLLLDEPTNHLDARNHKSLITMLNRYSGTIIIVTHDTELLRSAVDVIWYVANGSITVFNAKYDEFLELQEHKEQALMSAQNIINELQSLHVHEVLIPKFNLAGVVCGGKSILTIRDGSCGYNDKIVVSAINIALNSMDKVIIQGDNASGKSTLLKAILGNMDVIRSGEWLGPNIREIGYLDQHYSQLDSDKTAVELISNAVTTWKYAEIRDHLNRFLLRKNEEVNLATRYLSGGEKVRLSLALIAAKPPKLLLLDEITNNVDIETKEHLVQVLSNYPATFILICHEPEFVDHLTFTKQCYIQNGKFHLA